MPPTAVANACYTPMTGIAININRHFHESCKASERPLTIYPHKRTTNFAISKITTHRLPRNKRTVPLLHNRENFWTATAIQQELSRHLKAADVPNLTNIGLALKKLRWQRVKNKNDRGYCLRLRKGGTVPA